MQSYNQLIVDLNQIEKNLEKYKDIALMPMLKSNGYGVGMVKLARFFERKRVAYIGVSHLQEAIALREAGIGLPILTLSFLPGEAATLVYHKITPVIDTMEKIERLERACSSQIPYPVHLDIDTGFHRFGASYEEAPLLLNRLKSSKWLKLEGTMTHFAAGSKQEHIEFTKKQITAFTPFTKLAKWTHTAPCLLPLPFCNLLRMGYNYLLPHPAVALYATVMCVKTVPAGDSIGYDCFYQVRKENMKMAVISLGYHDGWHLSYREKAHVILHGKKAPMIGKICMDFQMIDITDIPETKVGDKVEIFGPHLPLPELAQMLELNPRQLLAPLSPRVSRTYIYEELPKTVSPI